MINISSQRTKFNVVISDIDRCQLKTLVVPCQNLALKGWQYWIIKHDKDVDSNGQLIRPHYHLVINSIRRIRVKQLITYLCDTFLTNETNIQVQECLDLTASIQYLIHKNDLGKYQYDMDDITTNDYDNLVSLLNETIQTSVVSTDRLIQMVFELDFSRLEIIKAIGVGSYQHYRGTINDLYDIKNKRLQ